MYRRSSMLPSALLASAISSILLTSTVHAAETALQEVVVTASLNKNPLDVAQPTTVMSGDDLSRQVATSLGETLSKQAGVSSSYFGPTSSRPVIRGLGGYRVQTLQDGIATLDVSSISDDHAVTIDAALAEQLEVLKGPATLLYGSGASGGLVNVVTHRIPTAVPDDGFKGFGELRSASVSNERSGAGEFTAGTKTSQGNGVAVHGDYFQSKSDAFDIPSSNVSQRLRQQLIDDGETVEEHIGSIPNSRSEAKGGSLGTSWLGEQTTFGVSASSFKTLYGIPAEEEAFIDMKQDRVDALSEWRPSSSWLKGVQLRGAYNDYTHTEFEAPNVPGTKFTQKAYEARLALTHVVQEWRGTFGAQLTQLDFKADGEEALVPTSLTKSFGLFALEERDIGMLTLNVGARAERQTIDIGADTGLPNYGKNATSVAGGAVWHLDDTDTLALNLTHTSRHPQATELYANGPHGAAQRFEVGDATLQTEVAHTVDLSWRRNSEQFSWLVNAFYNDYNHFTYAAITGNVVDNLPEINYRQSGATLYGYEVEFWAPIYASSNGSKIRLRIMSDYVHGTRDDGEPLPQIPAQRFGAGLHFDQSNWHAELEVLQNQKQERVSANELPTDGFTMLNADISYQLNTAYGHWLLFVRGTNLLDKEARQHTSSLKDIVPLAGRSLNAGVRLSF